MTKMLGLCGEFRAWGGRVAFTSRNHMHPDSVLRVPAVAGALLAILLFSATTNAAQGTSPLSATAENARETQTATRFTSNDLPDALAQSCREALAKGHFNDNRSFCKYMIKSALFGFAFFVGAHPSVQPSAPCSDAINNALADIRRTICVPATVTPEGVAKYYLADTVRSAPYSPRLAQNLTPDETALASSLLSHFTCASHASASAENSEAWSHLAQDRATLDVYRSCESAIRNGQRAFAVSDCNALISGLKVGRSLALLHVPTETADGTCSSEEGRAVADLVDNTCSLPGRLNNLSIARNYVDAIRAMAPEDIMGAAIQPPPYLLIKNTWASCSLLKGR